MTNHAPSMRATSRSGSFFDIRPARADDEAALADFSAYVMPGGGLRNPGSG